MKSNYVLTKVSNLKKGMFVDDDRFGGFRGTIDEVTSNLTDESRCFVTLMGSDDSLFDFKGSDEVYASEQAPQEEASPVTLTVVWTKQGTIDEEALLSLFLLWRDTIAF